ncbi:hypothetical protein PCANC_23636 [Puccinia coronata f. sp. avenae]|uniref:Uncharacterized protein n=1 Tax=Puccinia coronata f. sp. avenae TaxID=200324 RepID=A0A2N5U784_9BASI|nr:hypothetical protein PCANC_23636 [Puccinia coronata f. sp. avenae]
MTGSIELTTLILISPPTLTIHIDQWTSGLRPYSNTKRLSVVTLPIHQAITLVHVVERSLMLVSQPTCLRPIRRAGLGGIQRGMQAQRACQGQTISCPSGHLEHAPDPTAVRTQCPNPSAPAQPPGKLTLTSSTPGTGHTSAFDVWKVCGPTTWVYASEDGESPAFITRQPGLCEPGVLWAAAPAAERSWPTWFSSPLAA